MTDHDPLCVNRLPGWCYCDVIARVRADERERWGLGWIAAADNVAALAHAEAVAARLVEVICRMDEEAEWYTPGSLEQARHQRDAARAKVADLRAKVEGMDGHAGNGWERRDVLLWRSDVLALIDEASR